MVTLSRCILRPPYMIRATGMLQILDYPECWPGSHNATSGQIAVPVIVAHCFRAVLPVWQYWEISSHEARAHYYRACRVRSACLRANRLAKAGWHQMGTDARDPDSGRRCAIRHDLR